MPKESMLYINHILECIEKIEQYTKDTTYNEFQKNTLVIDAVLRNLEIIGEAVKRIPEQLKSNYTDIEWKKIAGLRDILIHEYASIGMQIIWDVIKNKLPTLKKKMKAIIKEQNQ